jgi:hypothetical protein
LGSARKVVKKNEEDGLLVILIGAISRVVGRLPAQDAGHGRWRDDRLDSDTASMGAALLMFLIGRIKKILGVLVNLRGDNRRRGGSTQKDK